MKTSASALRGGLAMIVGSVLCAAAALVTTVACSGGSTVGGDNDGGLGSSGSLGDGSLGIGDGGSSGEAGEGGVCTEFHVGGQDDPGIGGTAQTQVIAQSVADIGGAAATQVTAVTASCKKLATALSAPPAQQAQAEAVSDPTDKMNAWCDLAVSSVKAAITASGASINLVVAVSTYKLSVAAKGACQARCSTTGKCDVTVNPMVCTGGTLANGYCSGGKLEGGCMVDAKCDASCDVTVAAAAVCDPPTVAANVTGGSNAAAAATLKAAIEANLPAIIALKNHFDAEANESSVVGGVAGGIVDLKVSCIPLVVAAAEAANSEVSAGASATAKVLASLQ